jgi:hypothetical protein
MVATMTHTRLISQSFTTVNERTIRIGVFGIVHVRDAVLGNK